MKVLARHGAFDCRSSSSCSARSSWGLRRRRKPAPWASSARSCLPALNRRLTWPLVREAMTSTMHITSMVVMILIGSHLLQPGLSGHRMARAGSSTCCPASRAGAVGFLIFVNIFIFVLAFFLDFFEIAFIVIPMLAPVASALGIDLIWFGVLICVNMQTSFMHPPFGFALFYLRLRSPAEEDRDIYSASMVDMQRILVAIWILANPAYLVNKESGRRHSSTIDRLAGSPARRSARTRRRHRRRRRTLGGRPASATARQPRVDRSSRRSLDDPAAG